MAWAALKRLFDVCAAVFGLLLVAPLLGAAAALIKLESKGPVLFCQERIGRNFRPFRIYKFRTMVPEAPLIGRALTAGEDPRITAVGRILRKTKIDELPQLVNVLRGDMSIVGPRPEVARYVALFRSDYEEIVTIRPGITDPASLKYSDEQAVLGEAADPEREYIERILPDKIALAKSYVRQSSFLFDLSLLLKTIIKVFRLRTV
jgi:lipopolysaccharide/colanic/teichoic acid biosynthesis glycosyltransferase